MIPAGDICQRPAIVPPRGGSWTEGAAGMTGWFSGWYRRLRQLHQRLRRARTAAPSASATAVQEAWARVDELEEVNYFLLTLLLAQPALPSMPETWRALLAEIVAALPPEAQRRLPSIPSTAMTKVTWPD